MIPAVMPEFMTQRYAGQAEEFSQAVIVSFEIGRQLNRIGPICFSLRSARCSTCVKKGRRIGLSRFRWVMVRCAFTEKTK